NRNARTEKVFTTVQQALGDRAAPTIVSLLDRWPALRLHIGLICPKYRDSFGVREVEAYTQARVRFPCDEIELDTHVLFAAQRADRLALRGKNAHGRQFDVSVAGR